MAGYSKKLKKPSITPDSERPPKRTGHSVNVKRAIKITCKNGAPTDYNSIYHPQMAFKLCSLLGLSYKELGQVFGLSETALWDWRHKHQKFANAIQQGLDEFNTEKVETALSRISTGFEYPERTYKNVPVYDITEVVDPETGKITRTKTHKGFELVMVEETWKFIAPNMSAIQFILTNRNPKRWSSTQRVLVGGVIAHVNGQAVQMDGQELIPVDYSKLSDDVLQALINSLGMDGPPALLPADDNREEQKQIAYDADFEEVDG